VESRNARAPIGEVEKERGFEDAINVGGARATKT